MSDAVLLLEKFEKSIDDKDLDKTLACILLLKERIGLDPILVKMITDPTILTRIHSALIERLGVAPQMLRVGRRMPNRQQRAMLFMLSMENGVRRMKV